MRGDRTLGETICAALLVILGLSALAVAFAGAIESNGASLVILCPVAALLLYAAWEVLNV